MDQKLVSTNPNSGLISDYAFQTQNIGEVLDNDWNVVLKQAGVDVDQCIDLYGVDSSILNSVDMEFYYHGDHIKQSGLKTYGVG